MNITIPDAAIESVALAVGSALIWSSKTLTLAIVAFLNYTKRIQEQVLEQVKKIADGQNLGRELSGIKRAILRADSAAFLCEGCHGWDGPSDAKPKGVKLCTCSDPPKESNP